MNELNKEQNTHKQDIAWSWLSYYFVIKFICVIIKASTYHDNVAVTDVRALQILKHINPYNPHFTDEEAKAPEVKQ